MAAGSLRSSSILSMGLDREVEMNDRSLPGTCYLLNLVSSTIFARSKDAVGEDGLIVTPH